MADPLIVVVTGTNRGVGKAIVELLAKQQLNSHHRPLKIYATSRSGVDLDIPSLPQHEIHYRKLDIADLGSVQAFFRSVLDENTAIDILINNAAISNDYRETPDYAAQTIWNNYGGTRNMCMAFLSQPTLPPGSRIVSTTSGYNGFSSYRKEVQDSFRSAMTISDLDEMAKAFLNASSQGPNSQQEAGWGNGARSYKVSKALINALTILLAKQNPKVFINSCCPGWVDTDMGNQANGTPPKSPEEGARIPMRLAIGQLGQAGNEDGGLGQTSENLSGMFFENPSIIGKGWGESKLWLES